MSSRNKIFVGGITEDIDEIALRSYFHKFGRVTNVEVTSFFINQAFFGLLNKR